MAALELVNLAAASVVVAVVVGRIGRMTRGTCTLTRLAHIAIAIAIAWAGLAPLWQERGLQWEDVLLVSSLGLYLYADRRRAERRRLMREAR